MKTYTLNTPPSPILNRFPAFLKRLESTLAARVFADPSAPLTISLGGDLEPRPMAWAEMDCDAGAAPQG